MIKRGNASITIRDSDSYWGGQYKRRAVRMRALQIPPASDQAFIKVRSYYALVIDRALTGYERNFAMRLHCGGD